MSVVKIEKQPVCQTSKLIALTLLARLLQFLDYEKRVVHGMVNTAFIANEIQCYYLPGL